MDDTYSLLWNLKKKAVRNFFKPFGSNPAFLLFYLVLAECANRKLFILFEGSVSHLKAETSKLYGNFTFLYQSDPNTFY